MYIEAYLIIYKMIDLFDNEKNFQLVSSISDILYVQIRFILFHIQSQFEHAYIFFALLWNVFVHYNSQRQTTVQKYKKIIGVSIVFDINI